LTLPFADVRPEAEPDPWRDELPTLVFERPFNLERPAPAPDDSLSVVFRGARPPSTRPPPPAPVAEEPVEVEAIDVDPIVADLPAVAHQSTRPPERRTVLPLLPPPDAVIIPPAPRTPSEFAPPSYGRLPLPSAPPPSVDSVRPIALDARSFASLARPLNARPLHLLTAAILGGGALLGSFAWWQQQHGELVIDIADQQCGPVDNVQVYVDDELRCTSTPCTLTVHTGGHLVRAEVDGQTDAAARAVFVSSDVPTLHKIQTGSNDKTAIEVRGGRADSELFIDGHLEGTLPKRVTGLTSGEHLVQLHDEHGATTLERRIYLEDDQLMVLDLTLPPERAVHAETPGDLPLANASATTSDRSAQDATAEAQPSNHNAAQSPDAPAARAKAASPAEPSKAATASRTQSPSTTAKGTLKLTADPATMVLIDGRPLGHTPQRVQVDPGTHSLLFVNPTHGRSKASVTVSAGQTRNLHARF
jgi:hypothetical protein